MLKLVGKTVFITGASDGIGVACAEKFAEMGANIILSARRLEKLNIVAERITNNYKVNVLVCSLDVCNYSEVKEKIAQMPDEWRKVDILINNAGLARGMDKIIDGEPSDWNMMIDTNVKGVLHLSKILLPSIVEKKGQIINIGSVAGIYPYIGGAVYCASKAAVKFISDALRMEMADKPIKVTNIQPGMVETNFSNVRFDGDVERAKKVYEGIEALTANDIADICLYTACQPVHVQICEITVTPVHQAPVGAIYRKSL